MVCSIFMASITISTSPAATFWPTLTGTATTTPGSGVVSPPLAALGRELVGARVIDPQLVLRSAPSQSTTLLASR